MPTIPCPDKLNCDCNDTPFINLSSEAPDKPVFVSLGFFRGIPPLGSNWTSVNCFTSCESTVSQAAADQCARLSAQVCVFQNPQSDGSSTQNDPVPPPNRTRGNLHFPLVFNTPQTQVVECPDGLPFEFTVPAGQFVAMAFGFSPAAIAAAQADADQQARTAALQLAILHQICLSDIQTPFCVNTPYESTIFATGGFLSTDTESDLWELNGTLPPGLTITTGQLQGHQTAIRGTPTTVGVYHFSVSVTDPVGDFMIKPYTLTIAGITNAMTLPDATSGDPYSEQLTTVGLVNPVFSLVSGSLPAGLNLSASGLISGTPTTAGTSDFVVRMTDDQGLNCTQTVQVIVDEGACLDPATLPGATEGDIYAQFITAPTIVNAVFTLDSGTLPTGIDLFDLGGGTAELFGQPTTPGTFTFAIRATGDNGTCKTTYHVTIAVRPLFPWNLTWPAPTISIGDGGGSESHSFGINNFHTTTDSGTNMGAFFPFAQINQVVTGGGTMSYTGAGGIAKLVLTVTNNDTTGGANGTFWTIGVFQDGPQIFGADNTTNPGSGTFTFFFPIAGGVASNIAVQLNQVASTTTFPTGPNVHVELVATLS